MNQRGIIIVLLVLCFFGLPIFPYAHGWGWGPAGGIGGVLLLILVLMLLGAI